MNSQKKRYTGQGPEGPKNRTFCSHEAGVHHQASWHADVFSNTEAPQIPSTGILVEASSRKHGQVFTPFPTPLPSLENLPSLGPKAAWSFGDQLHPGAHQDTSLRQKLPLPDFTQEIPRNRDTLYHEPGSKANIYICVFLIISVWHLHCAHLCKTTFINTGTPWLP